VTAHRPRAAVAGPVAIAALFLAVIGASVGFVLGARAEDREQHRPAAIDPGAPPGEGQNPQPPPPPAGKACPEHTEQLAKEHGSPGGLKQKLYIRTDQSEVWICIDSRGTLFYQGHRGAPGEDLVEGETALFLTDVETDGDGYAATNNTGKNTTRYEVTPAKLVINNDQRTVEPVTYYEG
jgi:hypothetical protein